MKSDLDSHARPPSQGGTLVSPHDEILREVNPTAAGPHSYAGRLGDGAVAVRLVELGSGTVQRIKRKLAA